MQAMHALLQKLQSQHEQEMAALRAQIEQQQEVIYDLQRSVQAGSAEPERRSADTPFPTTDETVVTTRRAESSSDAAETAGSIPGMPSLTGPLTIIGGGKSFLNLSLDGQFSAAASTNPTASKSTCLTLAKR